MMNSDIINGEFSEPVALPAIVNSPDSIEDFPRISPDGTRLYFNRWQNLTGPYKMIGSTWLNGIWQAPIEVNSNINFGQPNPECMNIFGISSSPSFALNGTKMYFDYSRPISQFCEPSLGIFASELITGTNNQADILPNKFIISAYPNPFNSDVNINIAGDTKDITELAIYNIAGQRTIALPPAQNVVWDGKDSRGNSVSSGIYFVKVEKVGMSKAIKITLLR